MRPGGEGIRRGVPEPSPLQSGTPAGESPHAGGMWNLPQLFERHHDSVFRFHNREDRFRMRRDSGTIAEVRVRRYSGGAHGHRRRHSAQIPSHA